MNDLSGSIVNLVLSVGTGRGMDFLKHPIKIIANFNGSSLESDMVAAEESPIFNTELVWETTKKDIRKLRTTNYQLRVELHEVYLKQRQDKIGHILVHLRSASIIPYGCKMEIPYKWQKLLGVAAVYKSNHPELYLDLSIRDININPADCNIFSSNEHSELIEEVHYLDGETITVHYLSNGFIQIGDEKCETYLLTITVQVAYNLDLLLPETSVLNRHGEKYCMSFSMFGISVESKPFCRDLHANIPLNEKIIVRILSSREILQKYLTQYCEIFVIFKCGTNEVGVTQLTVNRLLQNDFEATDHACKYEENCYFKYHSENGAIPTGANHRQPYIEVQTALRRTEVHLKEHVLSQAADNVFENYFANNVTSVSCGNTENLVVKVDENEEMFDSDKEIIEEEEAFIGIQVVETIDAVIEMPSVDKVIPEHCGDDVETVKPDDKPTNYFVSASGDENHDSTSQLIAPTQNEVKVVQSLEAFEDLTPKSKQLAESTKSVATFLKSSVPALPTPREAIVLYQHYCLDVILEGITLKRHINCSRLCFKFKHPKSSTQILSKNKIDTNFGEEMLLENTRCKLFYISTYDDIRKMVYAWPPKLVLLDENGQSITEELDIYTAMFLAKDRFECSYVTEWKALRTFVPLAKISISMYLQEYGLDALMPDTGMELLPPMLDERIAVLELQDLQEWKDNQKAQFMSDLKITEKQRVDSLQKDWFKKKKALESSLTRSVSRCQNLSHELQLAVDTIRTKRALEEKQAGMCESFVDITQKYSDCENRDLIDRIVKMEEENECLRGVIKDQRAEIQQVKRTALTKEQTGSLLQQLRGLDEKFEEARKAKMYFKEQWKKAVREIHDLRLLDNKQLQSKIQNNKTELSQLSLDSFYRGECKADFVGVSSASFPLDSFKEPNWDPCILTSPYANNANVDVSSTKD